MAEVGRGCWRPSRVLVAVGVGPEEEHAVAGVGANGVLDGGGAVGLAGPCVGVDRELVVVGAVDLEGDANEGRGDLDLEAMGGAGGDLDGLLLAIRRAITSPGWSTLGVRRCFRSALSG
ncbi:MAG: hypothetical protein R3F14_38735 [Polyangiaceae bacterium]